jgi:hypothetical protein
MSYPQAFHTSCRNGLSGHAGFQFNAASRGLDDSQLSALASAHSGYRAAPDAPAEPDGTEIERLPVVLRYLPVDGVGGVVSRTAYVGREFRGHDGEPDSGRFGNYFSHILVGAGEGEGGFDGLMPIELWGAPHWTTTESQATELPPLERIEPGPVDLEAVLAKLLPQREAALGVVLDACLRAVLGGPRVVLVEPEVNLAHAWIAWASFALPADRVGDLTFSTFEGRPRVAEAVRVCVATPACDLDFPAYELGSSVTVIDVSVPGTKPELYGRVAAALARNGAEAVSGATRELPPGSDPERAAATLAVAGHRTDLVAPGEEAAALAVLLERLPRLGSEATLALAADLPAGVDSPAALSGWSRLHTAAREQGSDEDPGLVDLSLGRVLAGFGRAAEIEPVSPAAPLAPSVSALAGWSSQVASAAGSERLGEAIEAGVRLRLVGCNSALDRELVTVVADNFGDAGMKRAFDVLAAEGGETVVEGVALELAARVGAGGPIGPLRNVARFPAAHDAVRRQAESDPSFEMAAAWELLRIAAEPANRPAAVAKLAALAATEKQAGLIRSFYGEGGPTDLAEHVELLRGWRAAGRNAPAEDFRRAIGSLADLPLTPDPGAKALLKALREGPISLQNGVGILPWALLFERPPGGRSFADWTWWLKEEATLFAQLPRGRREELRALAAEVAVEALGEDRYGEGLEDLVEMLGPDWLPELGAALAAALARSADPERLLALAFGEWRRLRRSGEVLLEDALPAATRDLSPRRLEEVGERLDEDRAEVWDQWLEDHPPSGAVSRTVRGVFRRGEGKR